MLEAYDGLDGSNTINENSTSIFLTITQKN
jgi:hypothetical protein